MIICNLGKPLTKYRVDRTLVKDLVMNATDIFLLPATEKQFIHLK